MLFHEFILTFPTRLLAAAEEQEWVRVKVKLGLRLELGHRTKYLISLSMKVSFHRISFVCLLLTKTK